MKTRSTFIKNVTTAVAAIFLAFLFSCEKDATAVELNLIGLKSDGGYSYKIGYTIPVNGDQSDAPTYSKLVLLENGIELSQAHANHKDIRDYGLGQYSHWGKELYFSSSDNSNPLTNGRKYSYIVK